MLRIVAFVTAGLVLLTAGVGAYLYTHLVGNINTVSLSGLKNQPAAPKADAQGNTPENILVLGSQTRDGQHGVNLGNSSKLGTNISDTAMLVHMSAEKQWATVVSIPRDLLVPRPECQDRTDPGVTHQASNKAMFDEAMNLGGPACAVATVEQLTGVRIDHFVEVTFNALQDMTSAVGGVQVCVPPPGINDPNYSGLVLGPGMHTVSGAQALEFVRDRHGVGDGTDLGRIQYQQMFVSSLFTKLTSNGTLSNPLTLYSIAQAVTSNLTVDSGLKSLPAMVSLAGSVKNLKNHYIQMITAPWEWPPASDTADNGRVLPGQGFDQVWADLRNDQPLPGSNAAKTYGTSATAIPSAAASASASAAPTAVPLSTLTVQVFNASVGPDGTAISNLATDAAANLQALGVKASVGHSVYSGYAKTEILYPAGQQAQAQALAGQVAGAVLKQSPSVSALTLVLGTNAPANLRGAPATTSSGSKAPAPSISAESRSGDQDICSSLPTPASYGGHP
ncbi:LCP family protein [Streptacidiphilus sp. EB129]|uniref:LCP family protein n=1 Tax=Streptacidiphilus sp. EB129 TaxID=3156262 RepID=UPI003519C74F